MLYVIETDATPVVRGDRAWVDNGRPALVVARVARFETMDGDTGREVECWARQSDLHAVTGMVEGRAGDSKAI